MPPSLADLPDELLELIFKRDLLLLRALPTCRRLYSAGCRAAYSSLGLTPKHLALFDTDRAQYDEYAAFVAKFGRTVHFGQLTASIVDSSAAALAALMAALGANPLRRRFATVCCYDSQSDTSTRAVQLLAPALRAGVNLEVLDLNIAATSGIGELAGVMRELAATSLASLSLGWVDTSGDVLLSFLQSAIPRGGVLRRIELEIRDALDISAHEHEHVLQQIAETVGSRTRVLELENWPNPTHHVARFCAHLLSSSATACRKLRLPLEIAVRADVAEHIRRGSASLAELEIYRATQDDHLPADQVQADRCRRDRCPVPTAGEMTEFYRRLAVPGLYHLCLNGVPTLDDEALEVIIGSFPMLGRLCIHPHSTSANLTARQLRRILEHYTTAPYLSVDMDWDSTAALEAFFEELHADIQAHHRGSSRYPLCGMFSLDFNLAIDTGEGSEDSESNEDAVFDMCQASVKRVHSLFPHISYVAINPEW